MPEVVQTPKGIRPFKFWGIDLEENSSDDAYGDCVFCGREAKFGVNIESGIWHCLKCGAKGNPLTFIRQLYAQLTEEGLDDLAEQRGLISAEGLLAWGVRWDGRTGCHVIPGYDASGKLVQLYRYIYGSLDKRWKLLPTPTLGHGIHRPSDWKEGKPTVFAGEGPWDGIALWEVLRAAKTGTGGLTLTGNVGGSLYADANVCAIPGCGSVGEPLKRWMPMFAGSRLCLLFDSDHPRENEGRTIPPAGYAAAERAVGLLALAPQPPNEVQILRWGPDGYDPELPSGSDVRDVLKQGPTLVSRLPLLSSLLEKIEPIPESWLRGRTKAAARQGGLELECLPCRSWAELINQWRKAMKWTEGLDRALSVMLASNASTRSVGDQLWVKILGPASCLDGDMLIHDPVAKTTKTVRERCNEGKPFWVYTRHSNGLGIAQALPPERYQPEAMYEVTFTSGRVLRVTGGHRLWNGTAYVELRTIYDELSKSVSYHLPTISESALSTRMLDARRLKQIAQDSQSRCCAYSCPDGGQLRQEVSNGQDTSPLQDDALGHTHTNSHEDAPRREGRCIDQRADRLSNCGGSPPLESILDESELKRLFEVSICEPSMNLSRSIEQSERSKARYHTWQPFSQSLPLTTFPPESQYQLHVENESQLMKLPLDRRNILESSYLKDSSQLSLASALASGDVSELAAKQCLPQEAPFVEASALPLESCNTQPSCVLQDTTQQLDAYDLQTKEQPSEFPLGRDETRIDLSILSEVDSIVKVRYLGEREYFDFHVPETNNYWAEGFFHHNCGKSTLCEAMSVARRFVFPTDTMTSLVSGYQVDNEGSENLSLVKRLHNKSLVINDGDTLLRLPNKEQILSQMRAFYGRNLRAQYANKMSGDHEGINSTIILCGTGSLRELDSSELGERFLDCVVMNGIDPDLERQILWRVVNRAEHTIGLESDGSPESQDEPEMLKAKQLTGGYVSYLNENFQELVVGVHATEAALEQCLDLGLFIAHMRARPSKIQKESDEREFAARLVSQLHRLAKFLAVVLNRKSLDSEVMRRVVACAMDTAAGSTMRIAKYLRDSERKGHPQDAIAMHVNMPIEETKKLLRFMSKIKVTEAFRETEKGKVRWRLTPSMTKLWDTVMSGNTTIRF